MNIIINSDSTHNHYNALNEVRINLHIDDEMYTYKIEWYIYSIKNTA